MSGFAAEVARHWDEFTAAVAADSAAFTLDHPRVRLAAACGLSAAVATYLALLMNLDMPLWAAISAVVCTSVSFTAITLKAELRIIGTLGGAALSAFLIGFIADNDWMLCVALVLSVGYALYRAYLSAFMYAWVLAAMTSAIVYLTTLAEPATGLHAAGYRTAEIIVGVIASGVMGWLLLPATTTPEKDLALVKPVLHSRRSAAMAGIEAALGVLGVIFLYGALDLPGFSAAAISITRVADPDPKLGRHRGFLRLVGCGFGMAAGLFVLWLSPSTTIEMLFWVALGSAVFGYFSSGPAASAYAGLQGGIAFLVALITGNAPATSLTPVIDRLAGVVLALFVFWVVDAVLRGAEE